MNAIDELFNLMDLQKALRRDSFNKLNLEHLRLLRGEVDLRINKIIIEDMQKRGKSEEEIRAYIKESYLE